MALLSQTALQQGSCNQWCCRRYVTHLTYTAAVKEQERQEQARKDAEAAAQQALINAQQAAEAERLRHERFVGARLCRSKLMAAPGNLSSPQSSTLCVQGGGC